MKTVCEKDMCVGCMACVDICSKDAIKIIDSLKSYNASIDLSKCIECSLCKKVCQQNQIIKTLKPIYWCQGWANDNKIREKSSSGGIAYCLAETFIKNYGYVYSCVFNNGQFIFKKSTRISEINTYKGSKYVKSNPKDTYKEIKEDLRNKNKVLFIGLPCQAAALKLFIGEKYKELLYTADLICHGTPSPKLLDIFLNDYGTSLRKINNIRFRKKNLFNCHGSHFTTEPIGIQDSYTAAFLMGLDYTENCYKCKYAKLERISDITIGDSWGSELSEDEQKRGISLILCQTKKGKKLLENTNTILHQVDLNNAINNNKQLSSPSLIPEKREKFFKSIIKEKKFNKSFKKCYYKIYYRRKIKAFLLKYLK